MLFFRNNSFIFALAKKKTIIMSKYFLTIILLVQIVVPVKVGGGFLPHNYIEDKINTYNDVLDAKSRLLEEELLKQAMIADKKNELKKLKYKISRYIKSVDNTLSWNYYTRVISELESSNRYSVKNKFGYLGKYQIYSKYLLHLGYDGSEDDFLKDKIGQEIVMANYTFRNVKLIKKYNLDSYIGNKVNNIEITMFGMMASAHLVGIKSLMEYLNSEGQIIHKDGNDTSIEKYMLAFS
jgi:hypothetical protein